MRGLGCSSTRAAEPHEDLLSADCLKSVSVASQPCLQAITGHPAFRLLYAVPRGLGKSSITRLPPESALPLRLDVIAS